MSEDLVNIEVNGVALKARKGQMIMQVTDPAGIYIPRFCYHEKLSVAANCRMCLVEVEKAPKPLPACATPVAEGMKIFTKSPKAVAAQRATMEFLLINHPLDCPICDQGGECELQDLAVGYGRDVSRFAERKRVVRDQSLGPLVSTDMTRCIHCTRCVRFGQEIQGYPDLGAIGRGENMKISTYVERSIDHELSANIIDLCPVGALNNKPFRYHGRSWEMTQHALVSPHDGFGTNVYAHSLRGRIMRVVPRDNEAVNETWIADRDRFGFEGIYAEQRIERPLLRVDGALRPVDWQVALTAAAEGLAKVKAAHGGGAIGYLASPSATLEELYLFSNLAREHGSNHVDHRLRQGDFRAQGYEGHYPALGLPIAEVDRLEGVLVVGSHLRQEMPMLAHRLRKAAVKGGARVAFLNPQRFEYLFPVAAYAISERDLVADLAAVAQAAATLTGKTLGATVPAANPGEAHRALAAALMNGERRALLLGTLAQRHPAYAELQVIAAALAELAGASLGLLAEGANAAGAHLAGAVPHRLAGGAGAPRPGMDARAMLEARLPAYVLLGAIEPATDLAAGGEALASAEFVVAVSSHLTEGLAANAHVILPAGTFAETAGTYVNVEGRWQSWNGAAKAVGESRPAWKILRVLANLLNLPGFEFESAEEVREALAGICGDRAEPETRGALAAAALAPRAPALPWMTLPIYQVDALVRGSAALSKTKDGQLARSVI
ncbi:MAG: NADH-quinone oxidoreductase subunit G [Gammaproteobacteria bacterium]|nr:NADH-quinone oxidoreductase subunit G [Gammaproteobacteria bacterium]